MSQDDKSKLEYFFTGSSVEYSMAGLCPYSCENIVIIVFSGRTAIVCD